MLLASVLSLSGRYWSAAWPSLMIGVGGVAIRAWHVTRSRACWLTSLVGGVPPRWKCDCVVIGARNALTYGVNMGRAAEPRARLSRGAVRWALEALVYQHLSMARIAQGLAVAWDTANQAVLAESLRLLINDPTRLEGVRVVGVDEHVWRHTRVGDKYVTVVIDLTPVKDSTGPARLLDMVQGCSKQAFKGLASPAAPAMARWRGGSRDGQFYRI